MLFIIYIVTQIVLLTVLAKYGRIDFGVSWRTFGPALWILLFYVLGFMLPQLYFPIAQLQLLGAGESALQLTQAEFDRIQLALTLFLGGVVGGFCAVPKRHLVTGRYMAYSRLQLRLSYMAAAAGLVAVLLLFVSLPPETARSELVQSFTGQVLFAVSYLFVLGIFVISSTLVTRKRYALAAVIVFFYGASMLSLGGRGRVLWPIVGLIIWSIQTGNLRIGPGRALASAILVAIVLQALDPIIIFMKGYVTFSDATARFAGDLNLAAFFYSRNFDGFNNFALIVAADLVDQSWSFVFGGSQEAFMSTYYPTVLARGIGIPATLPGGLWLVGGQVALVLGGAVFGALFGVLHNVYHRITTQIGLVAYCLAMPVVANIGTSYLDSVPKMLAATLPGVMLAYFTMQRPSRYEFRDRASAGRGVR